MGANVRNLNWEEIDPNALHGAGDVVTTVRFWQRPWFIGVLFMICFAAMFGAFYLHHRIATYIGAVNHLSAFAKEISTLEGLDKNLQLELILRERMGIQDDESAVRQADRTVAYRVGTAWTAVRRSALVPAVDSGQIRQAKQEAERGLSQLITQRTQLNQLFGGLIWSSGFFLVIALVVSIKAVQRRATTLVVQSLGASSGTRGTYVDISASSLRESEAITRAVNNLPAAIFEFESDGRILRWNQQMHHLTGIPSEKAVGRNIIDCVQWDGTKEAARSTIRKIFSGESVNGLEWSMEHSLGERIDLVATIKPVTDGGGGVRSAAAVVRDVTSEKFGRELLISNDVARLAIIRAVPDTLLRFDAALNLVDIHDNSRVLRADQNNLKGNNWREFFGTDLAELLAKAAKQARLSQRPYSFEYEGEIDGRRIALGFRVAVAGPSDILAVVSDLSDRQRLLEAESRSEARFKSLIEGSADTIMMLSAEGIILYCSPAVKAIIGMDSDGLMGRNWLELVHKDDRETGESSWKAILRAGKEATDFSVELVSTSGLRIAEITARNMLADHSVGAIIFNLRDVSERRQLEHELKNRLSELKVQNEALQEATMRDPLTGALNYQALLFYLDAICGYAEEGMFSAILIDIDEFKKFNADFGFSAGDELLRQLTGVVREVCRVDDVFGRSGSEEFLLILPEVGEDMVQSVCERITQRFEDVTEGKANLSIAFTTKKEISVTPGMILDELNRELVDRRSGEPETQSSAA